MVPSLVLMLVLASAPLPAECSCASSFDALTAKVEANYLGYKLDADARARYERAKAGYRSQAEATAPQNCYRVLQDLVATFRDGHLFVGEYPPLSDADKERLAHSAPTLDRGEKRVRSILDARRSRLDPIEGIWFAADGSRIGVIPAPGGGANEFVAVTLETKTPGWRVGMVKAFFTRVEDGSYDATLFNDDHVPVHPAVYFRNARTGVTVQNGLRLHVPPYTWGKEYPLPERLRRMLDPENPRAPLFFMHDAKTAVFVVPSHLPDHRAKLDALIAANREKILAADTLIIDVRSDEGGSTLMTEGLEAFYRGETNTAEERGDPSVALSSPDSIRIFEQMSADGWPPKEFVDRLKAHPGEIVPLYAGGRPDSAEATPSTAPTPIPAKPKNVAIVIDGAVVSAGEAFVMRARNAPKVTLFGQNTGGVIDYQSVAMTRFGCRPLGYVVGYPRFAASPELPKGGVNATGIPPDVEIPDGVDPIAFIARHYAKR